MYFVQLSEEVFACSFHLLLYCVQQEIQYLQSAASHRHSEQGTAEALGLIHVYPDMLSF